MVLNYYYSGGKLHKADYEIYVNWLEEWMGTVKELNRANEGWRENTYEGKSIITDEK